jgi:hypothetical protein
MRYLVRWAVLVALLILLVAPPAFADLSLVNNGGFLQVADTPGGGTFAGLVAYFNQLMMIALAALAGLVARVFVARLGLQNNADAVNRITSAANDAAGMAYHYLVAVDSHIGNVDVRNVAIAKAVAQVTALLPKEMQAVGITPEQVVGMVTAGLGRLLASDPTISIAPPPPSPNQAGLAGSPAAPGPAPAPAATVAPVPAPVPVSPPPPAPPPTAG